MQAIVLDNLALTVDMEELGQILRIVQKPVMMELLSQLVEEARGYARPKAIYRSLRLDVKGSEFVVINGVKLTSKVVSSRLTNEKQAFAAVATCGAELAKWADSKTEIMENYLANNICEAALYSAIQGLEKHLEEKYHCNRLANMNPGSVEDWMINDQQNLFSIIGDVKDAIGVGLSDSFLMFPVKSVSGIWYVD